MSDLIDNAVQRAASMRSNIQDQASSITNLPEINTDSISGLASSLSPAAADALAKATDLKNKADEILKRIDNLPNEQDLLLQKRRIEALIQQKKSEVDELRQNFEEIAVDELKERLSGLGLPSLPIPLKLPILDPKILQFVLFAKRAKLVFKIRQKLSRENIKKGIKSFEYPIAKIKKEQIPTALERIQDGIDIDIPNLPFKNT